MKKFKPYCSELKLPKRRFYLGIWVLLVSVYCWLSYSILVSNKPISNKSALLTCPSQKWLGLPCPGCGTTRSLLSILNGNLGEAMRWNPLGYLALVVLAIVPLLLLIDLIAKKETVWNLYTKAENLLQNKSVLITVLIFILVNWYWNWIKFA